MNKRMAKKHAHNHSAAPTPGGVRVPLSEKLPLAMPYLVQIFPAYACNFRCGYCLHSLGRDRHGYISDETFMPMDRYRRIIDDIKRSGERIKMLRFAAIGEPLLHPNIGEMVEYAKNADIADSIDIVTNASILTHEFSDVLIASGLSKLRISLEGLSAEDYKKNSGVDIDYDNFVENIRYFYEHRGNTKMYIKIIDYMVQTEEQRRKFMETFAPITDDIAIEHLTPTISEIDYDALSGGMKTDKPQNGDELIESRICPQPFYMCQINPDGNVVPCCSMKYPRTLGNVDKTSLQDIWDGAEFNKFRMQLLDGVANMDCACRDCKLYLYDMHREDRLDGAVEELRRKYCKERNI